MEQRTGWDLRCGADLTHICVRDLGVENESYPAKGLRGSAAILHARSFIILSCGTLLKILRRAQLSSHLARHVEEIRGRLLMADGEFRALINVINWKRLIRG